MKGFVVAAVALLTIADLVACGERSSDGKAAGGAAASSTTLTFTAAQVQHGGVRWAPAELGTLPAVLEVPGQLVPNEDRTARLGAPAQGRVLSVHVQMGQRVSRGAPLVTLQSQEASAAHADHQKAVAELHARRAAASYARTARERAERLLLLKAIARQDVERAQADEALARAALAQAEAEVARAQAVLEQLAVDSATGTTVLRSPLSGVVLSRDAVPGTVAEAGAPLVAVTDASALWLEVAVPDRNAGSLRVGTPVRFIVPAFPVDTFAGQVHSVGGALDPATRTVPVRAVVQNRAGRLRPAMFATVWLETGERRPAVIIPEAAIQLLDERPVVFVAHPDGQGGARFERRDVELGGTVGGRTQVVRGLAPGDTVVVEGAFAVKSEFAGAKIIIEG
jgi:cobalt-zinc-cadmium efflux system membrane fusion protein